MPYIVRASRRELARGERRPAGPGELNFLLSRAAKQYIATHGLSYRTCNDVLGALEGAKAEFYRRVVAPYEDEAIKRNGDLW